eukprot:2280258-Prymnesium_polylepis.1
MGVHDIQPDFARVALLSLGVSTVEIAVGVFGMKKGSSAIVLPPTASAFLGGLLVGIALLVQLSDALEDLSRGWRPDHVFLTFLSSSLTMFLVDGCLLEQTL